MRSGGTKGCDAGPSNGILGDGLNGSFGTLVPGLGRWPANVLHDGSAEVVGLFPDQKPSKPGSGGVFNSGRHGGEADLGSNRVDYVAPIRGHDDNPALRRGSSIRRKPTATIASAPSIQR